MTSSPFLEVDPKAWVASNELAFAIRDRYPVSPGHTLVIPRRLIPQWFDASTAEQHALFALVDQVKRQLDAELHPDGYNIGFNAGEVAGQTVMHLHVHVIPRFTGDMDDPRGGVRGVIPSKQKYGPIAGDTGREPFAALPVFVHGDDAHFEKTLRTALTVAERVDIVSAFIQNSGVDVLIDDLRDALQRGAQIRVLAGDYLGITSADALRRLWTLAGDHPTFSPFLFETQGKRSFHPKSYIFVRGSHGVAYVGSSNISRSALQSGIEWNLRLFSSADAASFAQLQLRFEALLRDPSTKALSREVIEAYELRAPERMLPAPELRAPPPVPNAIQREALDKLKAARREGKTKGLVVLATGLGKTYLSAFDFKAKGGERALFVAHREEILGQARDAWQRVFPDRTVGTYQGGKQERDVDLMFASVQTLARSSHLAQFSAQHFDYIVVDEFHHAAASTYRKILGHFTPQFLLGLTATPERMDGRSLLELCGENLVFRRNVVHGISQKLLVPFRYFGVKDSVDFAPIPWRSGKFSAPELTAAVATEARAEQALGEYDRRATAANLRTLCFCCTVEHADYMAKFFESRGRRAVAVHSGASSAPRAVSLRALKEGTLEIICAVDVFNEGLDVPEINTILMLRPTESPVIFLQQLGRGLRMSSGKAELVVVDFIGNHRSFLSKPQSLMFLLDQDLPPRVMLEKLRARSLELPEGCHVEIETEAIDMLAALVQVSKEDIAIYEYTNLRDANGHRPSAAELFGNGVHFAPIKTNYGSWFDFVKQQGDLGDDETRVLERHPRWFADLLTTRMPKAYKMTCLRALLDGDALFEGMEVQENARRAFELSSSDLLLYRELREDEHRRSFGARFVERWRAEPLNIWARGESTSQQWFKLDEERFGLAFEVEEQDRAVFEAMTEELVELRLAEHRDRILRREPPDAEQAPIVLTVSHSSQRPILRFDRARRTDIPVGPTPVEVAGETLTIDFKKIAANVATRDGSGANVLPEALRQLFGPKAGLPGTRQRARLRRSEHRWRLERDETTAAMVEAGNVLPFPRLPFFPDVKVACGPFEDGGELDQRATQITVQSAVAVDPKRHFVVRASGDSMNGGDAPIEDGDLVLCEWIRGASAASIEGKPVLLVGHDAAESSFAVMKVPRRTATGWQLESWNPTFPPQQIPPATRLEPVAKVLEVVAEPGGLVLYGSYNRDAIAAAFGDKNNPSWKVGHRDIDVGQTHHTVLMLTLRKSGQTKVEHRYADRFVSPSELQWESQASTTPESLKGQRIQRANGEQRTIHLFVQYESHQTFTYLGSVKYRGHEGQKPMRVRFELEQPLTEELWKMWGR